MRLSRSIRLGITQSMGPISRFLSHFKFTYCKRVLTVIPSKTFFADVKGVVLVISSADSVRKIPYWRFERPCTVLTHIRLCCWTALYSIIDPTVKRRMQNSAWVFDIMLTNPHLPSVKCVVYRIEKAPGFVGRRTHLCEQCQSDISQWRHIYYRHQRSVLPSRSSFQWDRGSLLYSRWGRNSRSCSYGPFRRCDKGWKHACLFWRRYKKRIGLVEYEKLFMDMKTPLEALKAISDLLESESEFDMLVFLLIFFWENSYATIVFQAQHSTSSYQLWKFTVYGERSPYCHKTH